VTNTTNLLLKFFQQNGYFEVEIHPSLHSDSVHKLVNVAFQVNLKRHAKFGKPFFDGSPAKLQTKLEHDLTSWRARLREAALPMYEQAWLDPEIIQYGRDNLASYFQAKGYFDVKVNTDIKQGEATENIVYKIDKGRRHKVTRVQIAGNHTLSETDLRGQIKVQKASPIPLLSHGAFSDQLVRKSVANM